MVLEFNKLFRWDGDSGIFKEIQIAVNIGVFW